MPPSLHVLINMCIKVEETMGKIYNYLAEAYASDPPMETMWKKMAQEEGNHARQFRLALRMQSALGISGVNLESDRIAEKLRMAESFLKQISTQTPEVSEVLRETIALEDALADIHADVALKIPDERNRKMFQAMMAADKEHATTLSDALKKIS